MDGILDNTLNLKTRNLPLHLFIQGKKMKLKKQKTKCTIMLHLRDTTKNT